MFTTSERSLSSEISNDFVCYNDASYDNIRGDNADISYFSDIASNRIKCVLQIPLVAQHYSSEFLPYLRRSYKVERVSGDSQLKISFTETVKKNDVIICTAQILENYLDPSNEEEDEGINLSGTVVDSTTA